MLAWKMAQQKIIELVVACLHLLLSLLNIPIRCRSTDLTSKDCTQGEPETAPPSTDLTSIGRDSGYWMTDKDSTSIGPMESTIEELPDQRFASVSDARSPDECPDNRELSDNQMKQSWHSSKIRELERDIELLHLEVMVTKPEFSSLYACEQEIAEMISDLQKFFFG